MKEKIKLSIIFGVEFIAIAVILVLVFFAGKRSYTVTFDLNGGVLLSGDLVQEVMQGNSATPPTAAKDGCYFHSWSTSYRQVTKDLVIKAIWEYETTSGIDYESSEDSNYCVISGCFPDLQGDVYLGAYHDGKKVLGIKEGAFQNCTGITNVYMLDGIVSIGKGAFAGCTSLQSIVLPDSLTILGEDAFRDCTALSEIELPEGLSEIRGGAFAGCESLTEILLPESLLKMGEGVFNTEGLKIYLTISEEDMPEGFSPLWNAGASVTWDHVVPTEATTDESGQVVEKKEPKSQS